MEEILVARTEAGNLIYLTNPYSAKELTGLKAVHQFFCPDCGSKVLLKIGEIKIPHFAHKSTALCGNGEPESSLHLQGKMLLHQFFADKRISAELETYLPEIRQRADVLVERKSVIEFQCSPIASTDVVRRSAAYSRLGLHFTWIVGIKESRENKIQILNIKEYQREMILRQDHLSYLLLLNPAMKQFQYYSNLFHISGSRWIGKVASISMDLQSYPFAMPRPLARNDFDSVCAVFLKARNDFIKSQFFAKKRYQNPFWILCYELGLDMRNLPQIIGVPIRGAESVAGNAVIWQLQLARAKRLGISNENLLSSGKIKLQKQQDTDKALRVLKDYAEFLDKMETGEWMSAKQRDVLYDIYCKSV